MAGTRLKNEYKKMKKEKLDGDTNPCIVSAEPELQNIFRWHCVVKGSKDSTFEDKQIRLVLDFPRSYPYNPPSARIVSEIHHPNVTNAGEVCISILRSEKDERQEFSGDLEGERWSPVHTINTILTSIVSLLGDPDLENVVNIAAKELYEKDKETYEAVNLVLMGEQGNQEVGDQVEEAEGGEN